MAQKVVVTLVDDIDGGEADETVSFGLDGAQYEIDLSSKNAQKLRDAMSAFVGPARKAGRKGGSTPARFRRTGSADREQNQAIREWAKKKGLRVSERGRIPVEIVERYHAEA